MSYRYYDFQCDKCKHRFEALVDGFGWPSCPECNSPEIQMELSFAGYKMTGNNGASTTPKGSGGFKRVKK